MRDILRRSAAVALALTLLSACASEEAAVRDGGLDEGGLYEDGALEPVQPVEPEIAPVVTDTPTSARDAPE